MLELIKTGEYAEGRKRVEEWGKRLGKAGAKEARQVGREKAAFFSEMKGKEPGLYPLFRIDDKVLSEEIVKIIGGKELVIE